MTSEQIKAIQKGGIDWYGTPLKVDGIAGPKTLWWRGITTLSQQRKDVIQLALGYHAVGAGEDKNNSIQNDGTFVDMLLKPSGLRNQPWCLAFCSHIYTKCGVTWPKYHVSAYRTIEWATANKKLVDKPLPGDLCVFLYHKAPGDTQIKGHGEIVLAVDNEYTYDVGGNISDSVRVGRRQINPLNRGVNHYIRVMDSQHGELTVPTGMMRIDSLGDR